MGDIITFKPNTVIPPPPGQLGPGTPVNPTFSGRGNKIETPDILAFFPGSYWPGTGSLTVTNIMAALNTMVNGAYLEGLKQYGYTGPAQVRPPFVDPSPFIIGLTPLAPGSNQITDIGAAVHAYIEGQLGSIDEVDDNHDLIILVFLDPANPVPQKMDGVGNITISAFGANTWIEDFEFLDDNTRFEWCWIGTSSGSLATVTQIMSHELVESITDPFNSGWTQTFPAPLGGQGQISDVCNQNVIVDGVAVTTYWSNAANACVATTTGQRRVTLSLETKLHQAVDGPPRSGFVNLGVLCAAGYYDYKERTYHNAVTIHAKLDHYEAPVITWRINGADVPIITGIIDVPATWDRPPSTHGPHHQPGRPAVAHVNTTWLGSTSYQIDIDVGPGAGDVSLTIEAFVVESFDNAANSGNGTSQHYAKLDVDLKGQEIVWGNAYKDAKKQCDYVHHLANNPGPAIGPPRPGDPQDLLGMVERAIRDDSSQKRELLRSVADQVKAVRPELAAALTGMAEQS
jgi:hypothetical protein